MKHYAGLDVSVKETAIFNVDENGQICRGTKVISHPEDLSKALTESKRWGGRPPAASMCQSGGC